MSAEKPEVSPDTPLCLRIMARGPAILASNSASVAASAVKEATVRMLDTASVDTWLALSYCPRLACAIIACRCMEILYDRKVSGMTAIMTNVSWYDASNAMAKPAAKVAMFWMLEKMPSATSTRMSAASLASRADSAPVELRASSKNATS